MNECIGRTFVMLCAIRAIVGVSYISKISDRTFLEPNACLEIESWECMKVKIFSSVNKVLQNIDTIHLTDGVMFVKSNNNRQLGPGLINADVGTVFFEFIQSFLRTHKLLISFENVDLQNGSNQIQTNDSELADEIEESRGKNKMKKGKPKKNMLLPLIIGVKAKLALLAAMMANMIAAIAGKAVIVSKIALILGIFIFLKKLIQNPPKEIKHEVRQKIIVPVEQNMKHENWKVDQDDQLWNSYNLNAQAMAYSGQMYNGNVISHH